jgi:hypothetical protein
MVSRWGTFIFLSWDHVQDLKYSVTSRFMQRDYFWNLSRAILLAKESIYIHDWWLSPGKLLHSEQDFRRVEV